MVAATKSIAEFSVNVKNVKNDILAAREGVISKEEALKTYNDTLGKSTGYANSLDEAEKLMAANTGIVVQSLNLRARAQVMYQNAAQSSAKLVTGEVAKMGLDTETFMASIKAGFTGKNAFDVVADRAIEAATNTELLTKEGDKLIKQAIDLEKTLVGSRTAPQSGGGGGKTKEVAVKDENKALEEQIQIYKRLQQAMMGQGFITQEKAKEKDLTNLKLRMDSNAQLNEITQRQIELDDQKNARVELANQLTDRAMQGITGIANAMANGSVSAISIIFFA
jgi:hypothetical protein